MFAERDKHYPKAGSSYFQLSLSTQVLIFGRNSDRGLVQMTSALGRRDTKSDQGKRGCVHLLPTKGEGPIIRTSFVHCPYSKIT